MYNTADIRNLAVTGHAGSGKTTFVSAALFQAGAAPRLGRVEEGAAPTDFDEEEAARGISIFTAAAAVEWKQRKLNLLDAPGYGIFLPEAELALSASECMLLAVDAVAGVEVQTEKLWRLAERRSLPVIFLVNRMDRDRASFERTVAALRSRFGRGVTPWMLPAGEGKNFTGVADLVERKLWQSAAGGGAGKEAAPPAALAAAMDAGHEAIVELVAEGDDALMEEFFAQGTIPNEHLHPGLRQAVSGRRMFPVLCAAPAANVGVDRCLDLLAEFAPDPTSLGPAQGAATPGGERNAERRVADDQPLSIYVFKTMADPFAGRVSYLKVRSGKLATDANVANFNRGGAEKLSHLGVMQGKQQMAVEALHAGDVGAVAKLKDTLTGDTLGDKSAPIFYPSVAVPEAAIHFAIEPKSRGDEDKIGAALHKMLEEDIALHFSRDEQTKEFLLGGAGQQHVEIAVARLRRRYHVDVALKAPKVPYRETVRGKADVQGRHKKQTGGHGQFGDCRIRLEPLPRGAGFEFNNEIFGGAIPKNYIPAVEKGVIESAQRGYLAGFPVVDFRVTLYDGSYHDVDSSEMAFKIAGSLAFKHAMEQAHPVLLEPIMEVEVQAPLDFAGDLIGDLNGRRGRIEGMDSRDGNQLVRAQVPLAEMLNYQSDLTAKTQGRGQFHMTFSHYDLVPPPQAEKVIAKVRAEHGIQAETA
ncbi:MAG: elongation factor G [Terriglobales bacterium]